MNTTKSLNTNNMNPQAILIFDQEEAIRDSLHFVLGEEGYHCYVAGSKQESLEILSTQPVQLMIMDTQFAGLMPFLEKVKQKHALLKIILMSSYAEAEVTQQALARGADDFVLKPLDFDELIAEIKKLVLPVTG